MSSLVEKNFRRNYTLGLLNGAIFGFVDAVSAPSLVLALFVTQLGGSELLVGLLPAIYDGGWYLPQLLIAHRLQRLPRKKPVYASAAVMRSICWALIVVATFVIGDQNPPLLLAIFFALLTVYSLGAGIAGNAFMMMVAKMIPMARRGSFFGLRELLGTAMGLFAGYLVAVALSPARGLPFPQNFGMLFIIIFGTVALGLTVFGLVYEPREVVSREEITFAQQMAQAKILWQENHTFRRYLLTRIVLAGGGLATPFYAIYATQVLGAPGETVGLYIAITTLAAMLANPALSWISDRRSLNPVMLVAAAGALGMPLLALAFGALGKNSALAVPFALVFAMYGIGRTAGNIAFPTYLLNIAPADQRALYIGLTNTLLGIATFIPALGGILLQLFGYTPLFVLTLFAALGGLWLVWGLIRPRAARSGGATRSWM